MDISPPQRPLVISGLKEGDLPMPACSIPETSYGSHKIQKGTKFYPGTPAKNTRSSTRKQDSGLKRKGLSAERMLAPGLKRFRKKPDRLGAGLCAGYNDVRIAITPLGPRIVPYDNANHFACFDHYRLVQITIPMTGARATDALAANIASPIHNVLTVPNVTWHHVSNYSAMANTCTLQLVPTAIHGGVWHRGGVWQWEQANAAVYGP